MRTWTWSTTCLLATMTLCLGSSPSYSQAKFPSELRGKVKILKRGERAVNGGILLDRAVLLTLLKRLETRAKRAEAAATRAKKDATARVEAAQKVGGIELTAERTRADACRGDLLRREKLYERALKRCSGPTPAWKWYLATGVGAVVAGGLCVGAVAVSK